MKIFSTSLIKAGVATALATVMFASSIAFATAVVNDGHGHRFILRDHQQVKVTPRGSSNYVTVNELSSPADRKKAMLARHGYYQVGDLVGDHNGNIHMGYATKDGKYHIVKKPIAHLKHHK
jgi:hypothetical protein